MTGGMYWHYGVSTRAEYDQYAEVCSTASVFPQVCFLLYFWLPEKAPRYLIIVLLAGSLARLRRHF